VQNDFDKALLAANEAVAAAKQANDNDQLWQALYRVGRCQFKLQQLPAARLALTEAISIIEAQRPAGGGAPFVQFNESKLAPYLAMVDVLLALNQGGEAFHYAERAKTRGLLALLRGGRVWITKTMSAAEQQREWQMLNELRVLNAQIAREYEKQEPNQTRLQDLGKRAQQARAAYQEFLKRLYFAHPQLKILRAEANAVLAQQAGALLPNERGALLDYIETEEYVYLFVFTKERATATPALKIYALSTNRGDLYARLVALQTALGERAAGCGAMLRELYDLLLAPAQEQLKGKTRLFIAPDGLLWNLPFAALQPAESRFLIEDSALSFVSSLTALQAMRQAARPAAVRRTASRVATADTLVAFANPLLSEDVLARLKTSLGREQFAVSTETENEVAALGKLFDASRQRSFTGAEASERRAKSEAAQARANTWLHFAVPALLDEASPFFSALALAAPETNEATNEAAEDGLLTLREVIGLKLAAQLTVVSAAELPPTRVAFGRATGSASWAFFIAGCPALLLNQWPVESAASAELLQRFYRQRLAQPARAHAEAWQNAVRELLQQPEYRQPFYWAGFKLIGN
jgi:CHAT domain-containing protein